MIKSINGLNTQIALIGIMAAFIACTGPVVFIIDAANQMGYSERELISWISSIYTFGGIASFLLSIYFKMPLIGAHSLSAVAFIGASAQHYSLPELVGSFIVSGFVIILIGSTNLFTRLIKYLPIPIIDAMLAGLLMNYMMRVVPAMTELPIIGISAIAGFFCTPFISKKIPRFIGAFLSGTLALLISNQVPSVNTIHIIFPELVTPSFSMVAVFSLSIPLVFLILSNDTAVALSSLRRNNYNPPVSRTIVVSGIFTTMAAFFGGHAAGVGGMTTALCSNPEAGAKDKRYYAAIVGSVLIILFGVFAWFTVPLIDALPSSYITIIAGFSLLGVLTSSVHSSFKDGKYYYSAIFTFIISMSGVSIFQISSAVWALIIGLITVKLLREG
ncbi:benzoate transporter [Bacillus infantis]|uniref:benzoate/H(+) symporter BenE family transporter n=1 Tax=Bacillus infantis TaxID=324767 RepID=UPI00101CD896|nr:benzoate/H(+) symporter BenE family transporter [Bacillus infantis]RYI28748.1 benzoate transporter [Bacillus infantis]